MSEDPALTAALVAIRTRLDPRWALRLNSNRHTLLSLRWHIDHGTVSVHRDLLADAAFCAQLPAWVSAGGHGNFPAIDRALHVVQDRHFVDESAAARSRLPPWAPIGTSLDLEGTFRRLHGDWFAHTPIPGVGWARGVAPGRRLTHIRFGAYHPGKWPKILLHPRLNQPWVARMFVEHVLFHELCHHAQACRPLRGEGAHSERFRTWERRFPQHQAAQAWEKAYLPYLLAGTVPR
jgi:hypothetical protein